MSDTVARISDLLTEAAETHHQVYRITDGTDDDWASWYSDWLTRLSELPDLLSRRPVRSELTYHLVALDREYSSASPPPDVPRPRYYAERLTEVFASLSRRPGGPGAGRNATTGSCSTSGRRAPSVPS